MFCFFRLMFLVPVFLVFFFYPLQNTVSESNFCFWGVLEALAIEGSHSIKTLLSG
jgi:hypothetical protein